MEPRILSLAPMPPEKAAYALARYSRSADGIEDSIRWVFDHSSERFWEQFYFQYGHASIADLGHLIVCFEDISELAAIHVEDEKLWDGQAKSSRYQDFAKLGYHVPAEVGSRTDLYRAAADGLFSAYHELLEPVKALVRKRNPRPSAMKTPVYNRTIQARALDVVRYVLPLAVPTNVGQVTSIRTLEKQIGHLLAAGYAEVRTVGEQLKESCRKPPLDIWAELEAGAVRKDGQGALRPPTVAEALAPTLARYAEINDYHVRAYEDLRQIACEELKLGAIDDAPIVDLVPEHSIETEIATTLLYGASHYSYRQILMVVSDWSEKKRREVIEAAVRHRKREELLPEFQSGYRFLFDIFMDVGGWRDMHRHRRCQQVRQAFTFQHGYDEPELIRDAGVERIYRAAMDKARHAAADLPEEAAAYLLPFGYRMRCLFKMDFAEVEYVSKLRSGVKGHFSYRNVAWQMKEKLAERYPFLAAQIAATPPGEEDSLTR